MIVTFSHNSLLHEQPQLLLVWEIVQREQNRWIQLGKPMPNQYHFAERKMGAFLKVLQQLNVLDEEKDDKDTCTVTLIGFYMIGNEQHGTVWSGLECGDLD